MTKVTLKGFTPVLDSMVQEHGLITSAIYSRIVRFSEMEKGHCDASQERIGKALKLSRKTVNEHLQILVEKGYLADLTPDLTNKPHHYKPTGKAKVEMVLAFGVTESDSNLNSQPGVTESDSDCNLKLLEDTATDTPLDTDSVPSELATPEPTPEPELPPAPTNLGGWLTGLAQEKNKVAYLVYAYSTLFPEAPALDYGKMGVFQRRVGGAAQMLRYCYEFSGQELTDPITYIFAAHKQKTKSKSDNGRPDTSKGTEDHEPSLQDKVKRAIDHARELESGG